MPVINLDIKELNERLGKDYTTEELLTHIPMIGADAGVPEKGMLPVEFFPDRPDLFSIEGASRALRFFLASESELEKMTFPKYPVPPSGIRMKVCQSVGTVRPYVVGAVIRNIQMTDSLIQSLMDHQEKLHLSIGRKRVKAAIGVHDLRDVKAPFTYRTESPDLAFIPLMKNREMSLAEILEHHEKGIAYSNILDGQERYPIILDANGEVLSFPPIINGVRTAVTEESTDLFIDVTGMELRPITLALNIITTAFAERGASIESVEIEYDEEHCQAAGRTMITPDLAWKETTIVTEELNTLLNTSLYAEEWVPLFKRMTLFAEPVNHGKEIKVLYPPYRADILHKWDIFEDAAIGLGFERIPVAYSRSQTTGSPMEGVPVIRKFRRTMVGLGFSEMKTLTLTGERDGYNNMDVPLPDDDIQVLNPITEDHTRLRTSLLPGLLAILRANRHRELPQEIFEPGIVVEHGKNVWKGAGLKVHAKAGFTEMKSIIVSALPVFGKVFSLSDYEHPSFVHGRCASIIIEGEHVGYFGEIHPKVISAFDLEYPVVGFELDLEALKK